MLHRRLRRGNPSVNAGSMADIAFLLLIFFLVTTTILQEEGVLVRLPVWEDDPVTTPLDQEKVLTVGINSANELLVEGELVAVADIPDVVVDHLSQSDFPAAEAIVSLTHDRSSSYGFYLDVYDALLAGYHQARDNAAQLAYGVDYNELADQEKKSIRKQYPLILSEAEPTDWGESGD